MDVRSLSAASRRDTVGDDWSMLGDVDCIESLNYGILDDPAKPYLLHLEHGTELNIQLLSNNLVYPGRYDKTGNDILFVFGGAVLDPSHHLSFTYMVDAVLGYFYNQVISRVKDLLLVYVPDDTKSSAKCLSRLVEFSEPYKIHNLRLLVVEKGEGQKKGLKHELSNSNADKIFKSAELITKAELGKFIDEEAIPKELGGEFDCKNMDLWLSRRFKFELFWEDCRNNYKRLQYLPSGLKKAMKFVLKDHRGVSLERMRQLYREATSDMTFSVDQRICRAHSEALLEELVVEETANDQVMVDAVRTLARVMTELETHYSELREVLESSLDSHWKWQDFKKETDQLTCTTQELREHVSVLMESTAETETLNECYSVLQAAKSTFHEISERVPDLPARKRRRAEVRLDVLEELISQNFCELGKNNEKVVNTEFVLNIQRDILQWIKEFEDLMVVPGEVEGDVLRFLLEKEGKIRSKIKYCPVAVIEEYFETCQKIGTDFLLGSLLGVEKCISRLIERMAETSQELIRRINEKLGRVSCRLQGQQARVVVLDDGTENLTDLAAAFERILSLTASLQEVEPVEDPEIPDLDALQTLQEAPLVSYTEVYEELLQTVSRCVKSQSSEHGLERSESLRSRPRKDRSPYSSVKGRLLRGSFSGKSRVTSVKTLEDQLDDLDELIKGLEGQQDRRLTADIAALQITRTDKVTQKLYHILKEFKDTEKSYLKSLEYLHDKLINRALTDEDFSLDPGMLSQLRVAESLLVEMIRLHKVLDSKVRSENGAALKFARTFTSLTPDFQVYIEFIEQQSRLEVILASEYFREVQAGNGDPLPPDSYLNKPMQRLCKYKLLFEDVLRNTTSTFEIPSINYAVLRINKLLRKINGTLHLKEEVFAETETSQFFLYAKVSLLEPSHSERKAYLFKERLYISKLSKEHVSFELKHMSFIAVDKAALEIVLDVSPEPVVASPMGFMRNASNSLRRPKSSSTLALVFNEYDDMIEWLFKMKNILGKYY